MSAVAQCCHKNNFLQRPSTAQRASNASRCFCRILTDAQFVASKRCDVFRMIASEGTFAKDIGATIKFSDWSTKSNNAENKNGRVRARTVATCVVSPTRSCKATEKCSFSAMFNELKNKFSGLNKQFASTTAQMRRSLQRHLKGMTP